MAAAAAAAAAVGTGGARVLVLEDDGEDDPPVGPAAPERKSDALSFTFQWDTGLTETPIPVPVTVQNVTCNLALSTNVDLNTAEARWFPKHRVYFEVPDLKKTAAVKTKYGAVNVKISPKGKIAMSGKLCGQTWRQDILHAQEVIVDCIHLLGIHPTITDGPTVEAQFCAKFPCKFDIAAVCSKPGVSHIGPLANPKSGSWTLKQPVAVLQFLRTGLVKCRAASEEDCQTALAFAMPQMADCIEQGSLQVGADDGDDDDDDDDKDKDEDDDDDDDEESPSKRARGTPGMGAPSPAMGGMPALALPISGAGFSGAWPMM